VRKLTRDRALAIARSQGVYATTNPGGTRIIREDRLL
jgi:alkaline phosphatase isozyme conversion protein